MNQLMEPKNRLNIRLTLEFDGSAFNGWQVQPRGRTVQGEMEAAIKKVTGEVVRVTGCSRTDSGVHARRYVMNFHTNTRIPPERIRHPLNKVLPEDIRVLESESVSLDFHARKHALAKTYVYRFINSDTKPAMGRDFITLVRGVLDEDAMQAALPLYIGTHDFKAFMSQGSPVISSVRTIYSIRLDKREHLYTLTVTGNGFLYNMVRIIVGTLLYVGQGTRSLEAVRGAIERGERDLAGKVAPARGLVLQSVFYNMEALKLSLEKENGSSSLFF